LDSIREYPSYGIALLSTVRSIDSALAFTGWGRFDYRGLLVVIGVKWGIFVTTSPAMATPVTDTELREVLNAVNALSQRVEVGFANVDTKLAQMDTKFVQLEAKLTETKAELKGEIQRVEGKLTNIETGLADVKGDIKAIDQRMATLDGRIWTLVAIFIGGLAAISSTLIVRYVLPAIPLK
jgi:Skp family chaperone for outer membrane proteins